MVKDLKEEKLLIFASKVKRKCVLIGLVKAAHTSSSVRDPVASTVFDTQEAVLLCTLPDRP